MDTQNTYETPCQMQRLLLLREPRLRRQIEALLRFSAKSLILMILTKRWKMALRLGFTMRVGLPKLNSSLRRDLTLTKSLRKSPRVKSLRAKNTSKANGARLERLVGSQERIKRVAKDIVDHWEKRACCFRG